jgi:dienelactone hydrolase
MPRRSAPRVAAAALRAARVLALPVVSALGACAPLARDPTPRYLAPARPPLARVITEEATVVDGHVEEVVRLRDAAGLEATLLVKRPAPTTAVPRPRGPLVLILGGHHAGRDAARVIPDTRGHVVAALSYPYRGTHRPRGAGGMLRVAPAVRRAAIETPLAVRLALDWLVVQPWVDAAQVEAVGASLGVPFMSVAAATDRRITRLWAVHGAGRSRALLAHNARPFVAAPPLRGLAARAADALVAGPRLTAERWIGQVAPRPVVLINAEEDERLPRDAVLALWDAAREPRTLVWMPGPHVQRNRPEVIQALLAEVLQRMAAPPVPRAAPAAQRGAS